MKICNMCGKEFELQKMHCHITEDGTEYYLCNTCEDEGTIVDQCTGYEICNTCGYPQKVTQWQGKCTYCESANGFSHINLSEVEEDVLHNSPDEIYRSKLGDTYADNIKKWHDAKKEEVELRHLWDRKADSAFVVGILLTYILLEWNIQNFLNNKYMFLLLIIPTILTLITAPIYKSLNKNRIKNPLPIWLPYVSMAVFVDVFVLIIKFFN